MHIIVQDASDRTGESEVAARACPRKWAPPLHARVLESEGAVSFLMGPYAHAKPPSNAAIHSYMTSHLDELHRRAMEIEREWGGQEGLCVESRKRAPVSPPCVISPTGLANRGCEKGMGHSRASPATRQKSLRHMATAGACDAGVRLERAHGVAIDSSHLGENKKRQCATACPALLPRPPRSFFDHSRSNGRPSDQRTWVGQLVPSITLYQALIIFHYSPPSYPAVNARPSLPPPPPASSSPSSRPPPPPPPSPGAPTTVAPSNTRPDRGQTAISAPDVLSRRAASHRRAPHTCTQPQASHANSGGPAAPGRRTKAGVGAAQA